MTLVMRGELTLDEGLIIESKFDGKMIHGARNLSIGSFASVKADIEGEFIQNTPKDKAPPMGTLCLLVRSERFELPTAWFVARITK